MLWFPQGYEVLFLTVGIGRGATDLLQTTNFKHSFELAARGTAGPNYRQQHSDEELDRLKKMSSGETHVLFNNITMHDDALRFVDLMEKDKDEKQ